MRCPVPRRRAIHRAVVRMLEVIGHRLPSEGFLSVAVVSATTMRRINHRYRGLNRATDVLAFRLDDGSRFAGELLLAPVVIRRAAREEAVTFPQALERRLAHGLLHLAGFDHTTDTQERVMARWERRCLHARSRQRA